MGRGKGDEDEEIDREALLLRAGKGGRRQCRGLSVPRWGVQDSGGCSPKEDGSVEEGLGDQSVVEGGGEGVKEWSVREGLGSGDCAGPEGEERPGSVGFGLGYVRWQWEVWAGGAKWAGEGRTMALCAPRCEEAR